MPCPGTRCPALRRTWARSVQGLMASTFLLTSEESTTGDSIHRWAPKLTLIRTRTVFRGGFGANFWAESSEVRRNSHVVGAASVGLRDLFSTRLAPTFAASIPNAEYSCRKSTGFPSYTRGIAYEISGIDQPAPPYIRTPFRHRVSLPHPSSRQSAQHARTGRLPVVRRPQPVLTCRPRRQPN